ncbi:hypothetical protein RRG08_043728 [Elysia crispata]|uniref:Uncharacterized protein n=1 Tax=Elysia crispata TaxID=231223 RepID=A0AAE1DK99_9GAST|nr:hypothetical protein RRG08_043728 [Elysia crispata]
MHTVANPLTLASACTASAWTPNLIHSFLSSLLPFNKSLSPSRLDPHGNEVKLGENLEAFTIEMKVARKLKHGGLDTRSSLSYLSHTQRALWGVQDQPRLGLVASNMPRDGTNEGRYVLS